MRERAKAQAATWLLCAGLAACGTTAAGGGKGGLSGTLTFHGSGDSANRTVYKLDFGSGAITSLLTCGEPEALPDGRILCSDVDLAILSGDGSTKQIIVKQTGGLVFQNPTMSPDGRFVAYDDDVGTTPSVFVVETATGKLVKQFGNVRDALFSHPAWAPDGSLYFQGSKFNFNKSPGIYHVDAAFGGMTRVDKGLNVPEVPVVSPNGTRIAFLLNSRVWTMNADGSGAAQLTSPDRDETYPTWSPDGKWVMVSTGNCDLAALDTGGGAFIKVSDQVPKIGNAFGTCANGRMTWR